LTAEGFFLQEIDTRVLTRKPLPLILFIIKSTNSGEMMNNENLYAYLMAGNAIVTLKSKASGSHFTFKIREMRDSPMGYFVSLLTGPNNEEWGDYSYMGIMNAAEGEPTLSFRTTAKSCAGEDAASVKGFRWMLRMLNANKDFSASAEVYHEGRCGRCSRTLTDPESIETGLGPICREKMAAGG
jgi:hypothetical protein